MVEEAGAGGSLEGAALGRYCLVLLFLDLTMTHSAAAGMREARGWAAGGVAKVARTAGGGRVAGWATYGAAAWAMDGTVGGAAGWAEGWAVGWAADWVGGWAGGGAVASEVG